MIIANQINTAIRWRLLAGSNCPLCQFNLLRSWLVWVHAAAMIILHTKIIGLRSFANGMRIVAIKNHQCVFATVQNIGLKRLKDE